MPPEASLQPAHVEHVPVDVANLHDIPLNERAVQAEDEPAEEVLGCLLGGEAEGESHEPNGGVQRLERQASGLDSDHRNYNSGGHAAYSP